MTKNNRKYIAILFAALLLFPQGYQAIHVLRYHQNQPYKSHYSRHVYLAFEHKSNCPVLQFQLSILEKSAEKLSDRSFFYPVDYSEPTGISYHSYFPGSHFFLRAPPRAMNC
ncbi:MAG: hypothetical protein GYA22_08800 [Bacteroidales bacterium]|nr:hypothetical protein [Bacteroidales bacterium]